MQKEIETHKRKLRDVAKKESSILAEIEDINRDLKRVESDLRKYRKRLTATESKISEVEADIMANKSTIEKYREWIKRKLRAIYKYQHKPDILLLFADTDNISDIFRRVKYLEYIAAQEHKILSQYAENLKKLREREKQLLELEAELIRDSKKIKSQENALEQRKKDKRILLASIKRQKSSYDKMLNELKDASDRLLKIIRESEQEETAEKYLAGSFSKLKGGLSWPVEGDVVIPYGSQKDPQFNTPIFRSGAYIRSGNDSLARAVHRGKVVFAEWFKGYGQLVIINHGDGYHTLYGSLSEIFAKVGDIINTNQRIGRVGNSGLLNMPGLYFEIRYRGKPLDPLQWLKKK
ncbi:MAG: peptidoglycan DD-metalloendopeptidase family protein [Nitrospirota bacterium]